MPTWLLIILLILLIPSWGMILWHLLRRHVDQKRSLHKDHLRILVPRKDSDQDEKKDTTRDFKEYIGLMEQLLLALSSLYSKKISSRIFGQESFSLEYFAHKNETLFYMVTPSQWRTLIEKQVTSFFPDAVIEETAEINPFENTSHYANTCLSLKKDFVYPIKTHQKQESDPINNIANALSKLEEHETCGIQILLRPVKNEWQNRASQKAKELQGNKSSRFTLNPFKLLFGFFKVLIKNPNDESSPENNDKEKSSLESEIINQIDEKGKKIGYDTIIRLITTGKNQHECDMQLKNILSSFTQFSSPETNSFGSSTYHNKQKVTRNYIYRLFSRGGFGGNKKMILNSEEIASLFHFPHSKFNQVPEIKWQNFKIAKAPKNIPKDGLLLGYNVFRGVKTPIHIKNEDRFRHFYVIGQTGSGKSVILNGMSIQDVKAGRGICVMDPHGDLALDILPHIPRERADDVIYFNPADTGRPMGINLLEATHPDEKESISQEANKMMVKLFGNEVFGPRIQDYFTNICLTLLDFPDGGTLCDVMPMASNATFQTERRATLQNKVVKAWWENMYDQLADREKKEILPYFQAKFSQFSTNEMMRNIIGQTKSSFNVSEVMDTEKILLLNLSKGLLGDLNSNLLGMIFVSKIQTAALQRQKQEKEDRKDFFFYIDEFQNFVTDSIESILSEARKYRLSLNMAHQYIAQLEKSDAISKSSLNLKDAVFGNVANKLAYRIGADDAEYLAKEFSPTFSDKDLINQDALKASMKISIDNQPSIPFSIDVLQHWKYFTDPDTKLAQGLIELSRLKYGREKEFVDREILYRIGR